MKCKKHWEVVDMGIIYKIENKITHNIYIGQTVQTLAQRWGGHVHAALTEGNWGNYYTLNDIQEKDKKKNEYCLSHNILLKRIPYTDQYNFTYNDILSDKYNVKI